MKCNTLLLFTILLSRYCVDSCPCGLDHDSLDSPTSSFSPLVNPFLEGRIVGGHQSAPRKWPWMISIHEYDRNLRKGRHKCGASLINHFWALTAAHCVYEKNISLLRLHLGETPDFSYGKTIIEVEEAILHEKFVPKVFINDIALIRLAEPVNYDDDISPVCLPVVSDGDYSGQVATAIGWGSLDVNHTRRPDHLYHVNLDVLTNSDCWTVYHKHFHPSWLCAGGQSGQDACQGDSGGPLVVNEDGTWKIIGIISTGDGCAKPGLPGVYVRVTKFLRWISFMINNYFDYK